MRALRILTFNVKLLPSYAKLVIEPWLCPQGWWEEDGGWSDAVRARHIRQALLNRNADVVVLQELFQERERERLRALLHAAGYAYTTGPLGTDWLNEDSGLFVASRLPVRAFRFEAYDAKAGEDGLSDKGIACVDIDCTDVWPGVDSLRVFGTHLQSGYADHAVRGKQLAQLARFIARELGPATRERTVALTLGDFNIVGEDRAPDGRLVPGWEYTQLRQTLIGARDLGGTHVPGEAGFTWDGTANRWMTQPRDVSRKRLDYIFTLDHVHGVGTMRSLEAAQVHIDPFLVDGRHLSDHFAVVADLRPA